MPQTQIQTQIYESYKRYLLSLQEANKYRRLPPPRQAYQKDYLDFSTNDYLGLSCHQAILDAAIKGAQTHGVGSTGSRLLSGNKSIFQQLEQQIAHDKNTKVALIFNTGFQANFSALSALLDQKILGDVPLVFFDKLNHSSLYQAVFLAKPELIRYAHNDLDHLASLLNKYKNDNRPKFIVTETLFGMDGDFAPINEIASLAAHHKAFLYMDEAHATGIFGNDGYGVSTTIDLKSIPFISMGTFSKALGSSGGYIACDEIIRNYLVNNATGFIYSTANSPMIIGAASKAWNMVKKLHRERQHLLYLSKFLRNILSDCGFNIGKSESHIIPIIIGKEEDAIYMQKTLYENKIIVSCIRPPSVPLNSSRIRIALTINHTMQELNYLADILKKI